ncbi:BppU family phage baseplate upper protein [Enterococcus thailandicus]|uniref:BppU family phage baseplate upper protein n=1 Tax=Enterococcus thailandicus TaxID=417368 RepID=UPI0022E3ADC4|nr:BppU family phage baseplate upper protein [Enterococcus thailandicus]
MANITHKITLSTTRDNYDVGVIKVRQADEETQIFDVQITENGVIKPFVGLTPFFCLMAREITGQGVSEEPVTIFDASKGTLQHTLSANAFQMVGRNEAYFSFRKELSTGNWVEQYSTRSFYYTVEKSIYTEPFKDSNYWFTFKELYRLFNQYIEDGKASWEDFFESGKDAWEEFFKNGKDEWEKFVEDNRDIIEAIDPGGKVLTELIDARKDVFGEGHPTLKDRIDVAENLFKARQTQTSSISDVLMQIKEKKVTNIACAGDSLTYGYDANSDDRRPADPNPTDDGTAHTTERASVTYPEFLKSCFDKTFGADIVNVRNMGFSGVTTKWWYDRWNASGSDLFILMLGTNDRNKQTIDDYLFWMRKIILREYENGTPVLMILPPKRRVSEDKKLASYRRAALTFAQENNIPCFDMAKNQEAINQNFYSDETHFNGKGYEYMGAKVFAFLNGESILNPIKIGMSGSLSFRNQLDGYDLVSGSAGWLVGENTFPTPAEITANTGVGAYILQNTSDKGIYWCFETLEDNMVVCPSFYTSTTDESFTLGLELDFGLEQAAVQNSLTVQDSRNDLLANNRFTHYSPPPVVEWTRRDLNYPVNTVSNFTDPATDYRRKNWNHISGIVKRDQKYLLIAKKGFHILRMYRTDAVDAYANVFSLDFVNYEMLKKQWKKGPINIKVAKAYNSSEDVSNTKVSIGDICEQLQVSFNSTLYGENPILKVSLASYNQAVVEYFVQVGSFSDSSSWKITEGTTRKFAGYSADNHRKIQNVAVELDSSNYLNSKMVFSYTGDLKHQSILTISL